ncbi:MAG: amidophosphoribosyltransferase, partial [Saprospiraceae bacterium]|nr:amidophosphoribosyltransferase [Saprospiraceae bacterium]
KGLEKKLNQIKQEKIGELYSSGKKVKDKDLAAILSLTPRVEKIVVKDAKLRTFIADDNSRGDLVSHAYDVTYGIVRNEVDSLVLLDDSIVRGTTLRDSIIKIVARLRPKKIVIVSSAPQIRYPDCYGIDMSKMKDFVAFQAMVELLKEKRKEALLQEAYQKAKAMECETFQGPYENVVSGLYGQFSYDEVSRKIAEILTPPNIKPEVEIIYQTIEGLHEACPN